MNKQFSYPKNKIKILLLEKIHEVARLRLSESGYSVTEVPDALSHEELLEAISDIHILGVRSKTGITKEHIDKSRRLLGIGCFGVGTNQVDLPAAASKGIPVFNAPYGNTRSVAELTLSNIINLARRASEKSMLMHQGIWDKSSAKCREVRGSVLGIIGYGHIGQQVGILAEACGLQVIFYDIAKKLPLGNARASQDMQSLLKASDFVSLHIPALPDKGCLITDRELKLMKPGSYLLNLARGSLVDLKALKAALNSQHLSGAALDVYPIEPNASRSDYQAELANLENVIMTPHIGGATEEAQYNIALEISDIFTKLIDRGSTAGAVNFPQLDIPTLPDSHRILNIHKNVPGVLSEVNKIISDLGANIDSQHLATSNEVGYLIMDVDKQLSEDVKGQITALPANIRTRILY